MSILVRKSEVRERFMKGCKTLNSDPLYVHSDAWSLSKSEVTPVFLECTPMTNQMLCICCHTVRCCSKCCNTCTDKCSCPHDCELTIEHEGCLWWNSIVTNFRSDMIFRNLQENLKKYLIKLIKNT